MAQLFPSLMAADQTNLKEVIKKLESHVPGFHIDIMDNHFVPNLTFGVDMVNQIAQLTDKILWLHLMINNPEQFIKQLKPTGPMAISFHLEAQGNHEKTIKSIKEIHASPGIALSPRTSVQEAFHYLDQIGHLLIMSVDPGFSGQPFQPEMLNKIDPFAGYRQTSGKSLIIGIDGGVTQKNLSQLVNKGVDWIAVGGAIFSQKDTVKAYTGLTQSLQKNN